VYCVQYVKDTKWKQFTTISVCISLEEYCVQYVKDTKWKQFTTQPLPSINARQLCSIRQRYKMKAIHNQLCKVVKKEPTVFNTSKIQNESNSQHIFKWTIGFPYCVQYVKDTKWKQFTTVDHIAYHQSQLCSIRQRYKMKAIHNTSPYSAAMLSTVFNTSKIQNESNSQLTSNNSATLPDCVQYVKDTKWKQFTTKIYHNQLIYYCVQYVKDTKWKQFTTKPTTQSRFLWLCSIRQRYKMKAIHNGNGKILERTLTVFNTSKIQNESNSQRALVMMIFALDCVQYVKDTKWKQFTTGTDLNVSQM